VAKLELPRAISPIGNLSRRCHRRITADQSTAITAYKLAPSHQRHRVYMRVSFAGKNTAQERQSWRSVNSWRLFCESNIMLLDSQGGAFCPCESQTCPESEAGRINGNPVQNSNQEINMNTQKATGFILLTGVCLFGLSLAAGAAAADMADVNALVDTCTQCHKRDGASDDPNMPIIGGYSEPYIISSMTAYKNETRPCPDIHYISHDKTLETTNMCRISKVLSEQDIAKLAQYYAGKKFRRANQDFNLELARKGQLIHERDCEKCHSGGGSVASDDAGILAGQWTPYLKQQFFAFYAEKRQLDRKMKPKFNKLDKTEVEALLNFYASRGSL